VPAGRGAADRLAGPTWPSPRRARLFHREADPSSRASSAAALVDDSAQIHETAAIRARRLRRPRARAHRGADHAAHARGAGCSTARWWARAARSGRGAVVRERLRGSADRVILQPNCVIGSDGFGFGLRHGGRRPGPAAPQGPAGRQSSAIEDDVEGGRLHLHRPRDAGRDGDRAGHQDRQSRAGGPQREGGRASLP